MLNIDLLNSEVAHLLYGEYSHFTGNQILSNIWKYRFQWIENGHWQWEPSYPYMYRI